MYLLVWGSKNTWKRLKKVFKVFILKKLLKSYVRELFNKITAQMLGQSVSGVNRRLSERVVAAYPAIVSIANPEHFYRWLIEIGQPVKKNRVG